MTIKMVAIDMDDTLLRDDLTISDYTKNCLSRVSETVTIVLASGRSPFAMHKYIEQLGLHKKKEYVICSNGSYIIRTDTNEVVHEKALDKEMALEMLALANELELPVQTYDGDTIIISFENDYTDIDCQLTGMNKRIVKDYKKHIELQPVEKMVLAGDPAKLIEAKEIFQQRFGHRSNIFTSKPYFLELMPKNVDKAEALEILAKSLKIKQSEVMAVGDAMNDRGMIEYAGVGVAMANAEPAIKEIADIILTYSNDEDGVGQLIEKYLLN